MPAKAAPGNGAEGIVILKPMVPSREHHLPPPPYTLRWILQRFLLLSAGGHVSQGMWDDGITGKRCVLE